MAELMIDVPAEDVLDGPRGTLFSLLRQRRGWDDAYLERIEAKDHPVLEDMDALVSYLAVIRDQGVPITVMPDFDMDGITSGVLGWAGLAELGFDVELYIPDFRDGHDVSPKAVDALFAAHPRTRAVITCDAGINSHDGISAIAQRAVALVTDHHVELVQGATPAHVAVDPGRRDDSYEDRDGLWTTICGAHVLYQVLVAFAREHDPEKLPAIELLKLFAGIGTVSDVMPLTFENRAVVRDSLSISRLLWVPIEPGDEVSEYDPEDGWLMRMLRGQDHAPQYLSAFEGYAYALKAFREAGKLRTVEDIDEGFYGFYLAPAFNAVRRIEGSMADAFGSFVAPTSAEKLACVERIIEGNERRKELTRELLARIDGESEEFPDHPDADQPHAPYVYVVDAPGGMLGLLAQQLSQRSALPCIVLPRRPDPDLPTGGSARSPFWFPIISTLEPGGFAAIGHENACGVRLGSSRQVPALAAFVEAEASRVYQAAHDSGDLAEANRADLVLGVGSDADSDLDDIEALMSMVVQLEKLAPFGQGHERPVFDLSLDLSKCHVMVLKPKSPGLDPDGEPIEPEAPKHLRITTPYGLKVNWWNAADRFRDLKEIAEDPLPGGSRAVFRCDLSINRWMGVESVQASVQEMLQGDGDAA